MKSVQFACEQVPLPQRTLAMFILVLIMRKLLVWFVIKSAALNKLNRLEEKLYYYKFITALLSDDAEFGVVFDGGLPTVFNVAK